ncbi:MAG: glycoside hydrolase family 3 C-terminal domain-containing protein [Promethearchaeia archaeon]
MPSKKENNKNAIPPYLNTNLTFEERVDDLVSRMTLKEKMSQMRYNAPAIPRLNIQEYNWWNECLHGVAGAGIATVFPQAIGLAATFNTDLHYQIAQAIGKEARAKHHHEHSPKGERGKYQGLTFWSPNINLFRDPRWGRGQETYGECPYLTGKMGVAFIKGLQGDHPKYFRVIATPKHYAVHSGPEKYRHRMNILVHKKDLYESYLPHFKKCITEGQASSVMCAYNRVNEYPACANSELLQHILREKWGFDGYIVSDCGAIADFNRPLGHKYTNRFYKSAAKAVKSGCDLNCGRTYRWLPIAYKKGLISEYHINRAVKRLFMARFQLGMFDPPELCEYQQIPLKVNDCKQHRRLALKAARQSIVLLKNHDNFLPYSSDVKSIAVIGPNADDYEVLLGNYHGMFSKYVTPLRAIRNKLGSTVETRYAQGCKMRSHSTRGFSEAIEIAKNSELVLAVLGISQKYEGEDSSFPWNDDDREFLGLPSSQQILLEKLYDVNTNIILVLLNGSPMTVNWAQKNIPAIIEAWYPGEMGGQAIADVIFGDYNPAGRLPITFPKNEDDLPPFLDYSMKNRTYRYSQTEPLYSFGFGLSYTTFQYSNLTLSQKEINLGDSVEISVDVTNTGKRKGGEVVQLYLKDMEASVRVPKYELRGFKRIVLLPNEKTRITFNITPRDMALINVQGKCILEPGKFTVFIGGQQPDKRSAHLMDSHLIETTFSVYGNPKEIEY